MLYLIDDGRQTDSVADWLVGTGCDPVSKPLKRPSLSSPLPSPVHPLTPVLPYIY